MFKRVARTAALGAPCFLPPRLCAGSTVPPTPRLPRSNTPLPRCHASAQSAVILPGYGVDMLRMPFFAQPTSIVLYLVTKP